MTESAPRTSRRRIVVESARILFVSFVGWAAGAVVLGVAAAGTLAADIGLLVLATVLWAVIPATILRLLRLRSGASQPTPERPRTWVIWFVIAALTGSTIIGIIRPLVDAWSTLQIWSTLFLLTPIGIALDSVPRLIRPAGWTSALARLPRVIPIAVTALSLLAFILAMSIGNGVIQRGQDAVTFVPTLPVEGLVVAIVLSFAAVLALAAGVPGIANGAIGLLFAASSFVVQLTWLPVVTGSVVVDRALLAGSHIGAALALAIAVGVIQVFRHTGASTAESALVDWLRAEAILPEANPAESKASS
ncbi:MAG TPA: hypothetical protein VK867_03585 [Candidatus Limnocylindrales bacterium]|nr:hypothetical protein [Candidatus Limnocylindrales bacterium]